MCFTVVNRFILFPSRAISRVRIFIYSDSFQPPLCLIVPCALFIYIILFIYCASEWIFFLYRNPLRYLAFLPEPGRCDASSLRSGLSIFRLLVQRTELCSLFFWVLSFLLCPHPPSYHPVVVLSVSAERVTCFSSWVFSPFRFFPLKNKVTRPA